ncbi:LLM class flavin-dependent oxidoreductase [Nonomuraea sp. NPDC000554]|uniref:LLM class flavin-dependent oxidoreductase n=1 Tax=Nonomuraea sp. NPDC000554 TaxID=3154259 RepID=UPI00332C990A
MPMRHEQVLPFAALVQWTSARRLWQGQALTLDTHHGFVFAAGAGFKVPMGVGVALMPFRHPHEAALHARSVAVASGHPFVAGIGPGAVDFQRHLGGGEYASQLKAIREYVVVMRTLLDGDEVDLDGEYFTAHAALPPLPTPEVEVGLGVLRPGMARLAGEVADVAITWLTPASYLRDVIVPAMREGAEKVGRPMPRLVAMVPMFVAEPDRDPTRIVLESNGVHLMLPHYRDMLSRAGIEIDAQQPAESVKRLISGGGFLSGTPEELAQQMDEFHAVGVDEVVLNLTGVARCYGNQVAMGEMETILGEAAP